MRKIRLRAKADGQKPGGSTKECVCGKLRRLAVKLQATAKDLRMIIFIARTGRGKMG